ncbi:MAG: hypothetical protein ABI777_01260 [Betaproteobacteria bacterium]
MGEAAQLIRCLGGVLALALAASAVAQDYAIEGSCRDGAPHGNYELRGPSGQVRVVGAFARGKRTGSFLFWSSVGARIAQLPFDDDALSGTVALWYPPAGRAREGQPKLEAAYAAGRLHGLKRSWHPDGRVRSEYHYDRGRLVDARAFNAMGAALATTAAEAQAARDLVTDDQYYATLADLVRAHRPQCPSALDRLERQ